MSERRKSPLLRDWERVKSSMATADEIEALRKKIERRRQRLANFFLFKQREAELQEEGWI